MGLNNIMLPPLLLAKLYKNVLVEEEGRVSAKPAAGNPAEAPVSFLGKNQRNICLLVNYPSAAYLPEEQLNLLTTMLQACRLNLADVAIVNRSRSSCTFTTLVNQFNCNILLVFGAEPILPGLEPIPEFLPRLAGNTTVMMSPVLDQLDNSKEGKLMKSKLWLCLKQIFTV
jgi:hypothetical protein